MAEDKVKQQRDRFLAFAFASADLFLEVGEDSNIAFALGAARSLTGINEQSLIGRGWMDMFAAPDHPRVKGLKAKARPAERCGPILVRLDDELGGGREAIVTAIRMPDSKKFFITIGFPSAVMAQYAAALQGGQSQLMDKDNFLIAAREALNMARSLGQDLDLTLLDINDIDEVKTRLGDEKWDQFTDAITHLLNAQSVDGQAAAVIGEGRYSVVHDSSVSVDIIKSEIERLSREADPDGGGFSVDGKTVSADLSSLSERDTTKALIYTINEFERRGTSLTIDNLNSSFKNYVTVNAQKIAQFKTMVEQLNFELHFQPIVDLKTGESSHYEMLARFKDGDPTQEWVVFGEDIGMAADFDIAVCERAMNYLLYKSQGRRTKFAINLSGQSIQNEQFFKTLHAKLLLNKSLAERMIFEITESTTITDLDTVNHFIQTLQGEGYKVCLDDFGAGSASFQYLQALHVDYVKIDGDYIRKLLTSERDAIMIKNLSRMCNDLNIGVIAERVEEEAQAERLRTMGIPYGQGYLFSPARTKPDYEPKKPAT